MAQITCGFIGLGLIGGSIARALREKRKKNVKIIAYDIHDATLALAKEEKVADVITNQIDENFSSCDYLFLCAPVMGNGVNLSKVREYLSPSCTLTDVGSVKNHIHREIQALGLQSQFIGGHPMAGSERTGYRNSKSRLLENAYYILTPSKECTAEKIREYQELVQSMGAIPLVLDPLRHDYVTAAVSHLPHVIAASLVNLVKESDSEDGTMKLIAAGGFKDITRIASSSPDMWEQICTTNSENISELLGRYIADLLVIKEALDDRDALALNQFFSEARRYRDSFIDASSGPLKKVYSLYVDIADEAGALAAIATLLALNGISIKNIGITHNREAQEGALRIEFYEESATRLARSLLTSKGYLIYDPK